jgi:hypothetical protein
VRLGLSCTRLHVFAMPICEWLLLACHDSVCVLGGLVCHSLWVQQWAH